MRLQKVDYVDGQTKITAKNLNEIQDAIIKLEEKAEEEGNGENLPEINENGILIF